MEIKKQGWLIFKTDQGWEMQTVSNTSDLISASEGTYWLMPNGMPRIKAQLAEWIYAFHQLPSPVLAWATLLQAQTLPINHHDPHHNPKSFNPDTETDTETDSPTSDTSSNH